MAGVLLASLLLMTASDEFEPRHHGEAAATVARAGVADGMEDPARYGFEYRFRAFGEWRIYPAMGVMSAGDGASFVYVDLRHDYALSDDWFLGVSFGAGRFDPHDVLDLGHLLEFRSGVSVSRLVADRFRVELGIYHFSNGGLGRRNPGTEALVLSLGIPLHAE